MYPSLSYLYVFGVPLVPRVGLSATSPADPLVIALRAFRFYPSRALLSNLVRGKKSEPCLRLLRQAGMIARIKGFP